MTVTAVQVDVFINKSSDAIQTIYLVETSWINLQGYS